MAQTEKEYWEKEPWSLLVKRYDIEFLQGRTTLEIQIKFPTILSRLVDQFDIDLLDDDGNVLVPRKFKALTLGELTEKVKEMNK